VLAATRADQDKTAAGVIDAAIEAYGKTIRHGR
jgi:hypothetical protein